MSTRYNLRQCPKKTKILLVEETFSKVYDYCQHNDFNIENPLLTIKEVDRKRKITFRAPFPLQEVHDNDPDQWAFWIIPDPNNTNPIPENFKINFDEFLLEDPEFQENYEPNLTTLPNIIEE